MELNMCGIAPSETIMNELYGWGEFPFNWVGERVAEFNALKVDEDSQPVMNCVLNPNDRKEDTEWRLLFVYPEDDDKLNRLGDAALKMLAAIHNVDQKMFRVKVTHDGVTCVAFM